MLVNAVQSSTLTSIAYDPIQQRLWLVFRSRAVYCYFGVPRDVHQGLLTAASKGRYFNRCIRGRFPFQKQLPSPR